MNILAVGAGAVGGYFGARLAQVGRDVTFLVRSKRAEALRRDGLQIVSPHGDLTLQPKLILASEITHPYDVILLSVKAYGLDSAMNDFAPAVGPDTILLPMLNGMCHLETLIARFGPAPVIGGVCRVSTELDDAGRILQLTSIQKITYGELAGGSSPRIQALDQTLRDSGFETVLSENIYADMWEKWLMLASLGAITCLFRGTIGDVEAAPGGKDLAMRILAESAAISAANGYPPSEQSLNWARSVIATPGSSMTASMYRDMISGGPTEATHILGDLIARGRTHSIDTPLLQAAFVALSVYESRRT
jgi:2-dehydropantoate 2-reductase